MNKIKLVALDMDGTLLNDDGVVSNYTKSIIEEALLNDVEIVLCTGRPLPMCASYADDLQLNSYIITSNGAEIWEEKNKLLKRQIMDVDHIEKLWKIGDKHRLHMWLVAVDEIFSNSERPVDFYHHDWLKFGYGNLNDEMKSILLKELTAFTNLEVTNSSNTNIEINKAGVNKANAIKMICKKIGISMNEVMTVGDSLNDLKMIERAGIGVAVGNAQKQILDAADYVTESNNDDGVAKAIERFVLGNKKVNRTV